MVCKSCQLVEMARVARQGEVDVYRCPKCGREERVRIKPEEREKLAGTGRGWEEGAFLGKW